MAAELRCSIDEVVEPNGRELLSSDKNQVLPPIGTELFLAGQEKDNNLPHQVIKNPKVIEQAESRRRLYRLFDCIFEAIPNTECDIGEAVRKRMVTESDVATLWDGLSDFLEQDENNVRILLYLPFEMLPNPYIYDFPSNHMANSGQRLASICRQGWIKLLHQTEPRANYVNGDILEPGLGESEKISKAGHLTPELIEKRIISEDDICTLLEIFEDRKLLKSLAEGAMVSISKGLIDKTYSEKISGIVGNKMGKIDTPLTKKREIFNDPTSLKMSSERIAWLRTLKEEDRSNKKAEIISRKIINGVDLNKLIDQEKLGHITTLGIIKTGELLFHSDFVKAREFTQNAEHYIESAWDLKDAKTRDEIIRGLNRWERLGIVNNDFLQKLGIALTDLSSPVQYDKIKASKEVENLSIAATKIQEHPFLSKRLYPTFLLFGSRLKGYADTNADIDAALFFRPGTKFEDREEILKTLKKDIPEVEMVDKFLEFWTTQGKGRIQFKLPQTNTRIFIGEDQIHFLMGGIWIGYGEDLKKIGNDALMNYLDLSRHGKEKEEVRARLLGQIELDALQYRLMHRGYKKYYPQADRVSIPNSNLIDWNSDFWDPGYRRVATKLFISRVFLPDLS